MKTTLFIAVAAMLSLVSVGSMADAGITGIANADMAADTDDEFDGWFNNELVPDPDNIRFHNLASSSTSGQMSLSGQLEFSQVIGFVDVGGNDLDFSVEIGKGTGADFSNGYDFEVRIGSGPLTKAADNTIDVPTWNTGFYQPVISFTAAELAPHAGLPIEIYGASRFPDGDVSRTLGFDNWAAGSPPPPPAAMPPVASSVFAYRYEMDVQPNTQDLDGVGGGDFNQTYDIGAAGPPGGIASVSFTDTSTDNNIDTGFDNSIWREHFLSSDGDWTMETRLKVTTPDDGSEGGTGSLALLMASNDTTDENVQNFWLRVGRDDMRITLPGGALETIDTGDNHSEFVSIRVAHREDKYYVWRNDELLNDGLDRADGFDWAPNTIGGGAAFLRSDFAIDGRAFSSSLSGSADFDYIHLDPSQAMQPVPEPATYLFAVLGLIGLGCFTRGRR